MERFYTGYNPPWTYKGFYEGYNFCSQKDHSILNLLNS